MVGASVWMFQGANMHLKSSDVLPQRSGPFMKSLEHVVPKPILDYGQCIFNVHILRIVLLLFYVCTYVLIPEVIHCTHF